MGLTLLPNAGQSLLITRAPIRNNFSVISTALEVDHVAYNDSGQGWHNKVTLPSQSVAPDATGTNNITLFSREVNAVTQLFLALGQAGGFRDLTSAGLTTPGWSRLPSGLLIKWGQTSGGPFVNNSPTITFPTTFGGDPIPAFTTCLGVMTSYLDSITGNFVETRALDLHSYTALSFRVNVKGLDDPPASHTNIIWLAFGKE